MKWKPKHVKSLCKKLETKERPIKAFFKDKYSLCYDIEDIKRVFKKLDHDISDYEAKYVMRLLVKMIEDPIQLYLKEVITLTDRACLFKERLNVLG